LRSPGSRNPQYPAEVVSSGGVVTEHDAVQRKTLWPRRASLTGDRRVRTRAAFPRCDDQRQREHGDDAMAATNPSCGPARLPTRA
jgi:hypothetical protein